MRLLSIRVKRLSIIVKNFHQPVFFTRKLKQCNQILESYLLKVIVDQGFQLTSLKSELQLRIFVTFFFLSYYGRRTLPFPIEKRRSKKLWSRIIVRWICFRKKAHMSNLSLLCILLCISWENPKELHLNGKLETLMYSW